MVQKAEPNLETGKSWLVALCSEHYNKRDPEMKQKGTLRRAARLPDNKHQN